jgi:hypothetical protein
VIAPRRIEAIRGIRAKSATAFVAKGLTGELTMTRPSVFRTSIFVVKFVSPLAFRAAMKSNLLVIFALAFFLFP